MSAITKQGARKRAGRSLFTSLAQQEGALENKTLAEARGLLIFFWITEEGPSCVRLLTLYFCAFSHNPFLFLLTFNQFDPWSVHKPPQISFCGIYNLSLCFLMVDLGFSTILLQYDMDTQSLMSLKRLNFRVLWTHTEKIEKIMGKQLSFHSLNCCLHL